MLFNTRKVLLGFVLSLCLLPMVAFASTEFKGTETVNINKANAATLAAYLKGIGANKATAIVKYRQSNGRFKSAADIKNVPGVGDETYKDIKSKISTSRGKSTAPQGYKLAETSGKSKSTKKRTTKKKATAKKTTSAKAKKSTSSTTTKAKKKSTAKKTSMAKKKPTAKKKTSSSKKSTAKKSTVQKTKAKKTTRKKKTVKCKSGQKKVKGKCVSK